MATYNKKDFTEEQLKVISRLVDEGKKLHKRLDFLKRTSDPSASYESLVTHREEKERVKNNIKHISDELNQVLNARTVFDNCVVNAKESIETAEELKKRWGF